MPELNLTLTQKARLTRSKQKGAGANNKLRWGSTETALGHDERLDDGFFSLYGFFGYDKYAATSAIPLGDFYRYGLDFYYAEKQWDEWGVWLTGTAEWAARYNVSSSLWLKSGGTYKLGGGPSYDFNDKFSLYAGAYFTTRLADQNQMFPVVGIAWKITPKLSLRTANGVFLTYDFWGDKKLLLEASSEYLYKQFRLKDNAISTTIGNREQAMTSRAWVADFGATYQILDNLWVRGFGGIITQQELKAKSDGKTITKVKAKTGYNLGAQAGYSF